MEESRHSKHNYHAEPDLSGLIYLERYRNAGTRTYSQYSDYTEALPAYRPDSRSAEFDLPLFEVPRSRMLVYTADPPEELERRYLKQDSVRFCIHPQVLDRYPDDRYVRLTRSIGRQIEFLRVSPSSSTRTLYVLEKGPRHAAKVHFPFRISRYGRKMRDEVIEQAINISRELEQGIGAFDNRFGFLREVIGVAHRNIQPRLPRPENWGYLVRDLVPFPVQGRSGDLIPGFALYGRDFFDPKKPPLLFELIGNRPPLDSILEKILFPIIRHWVCCFQNFGFLLEPHGQNVLLEISPEGGIRRTVHRDLSLGIDMRRRRELGLGDERLNCYNRMEDGRFHSVTYDRFMGDHFFNRIVATCREKHPNIEKKDFTGPCRDEFARAFPDHAAWIPRTVRYFSDKRDQFDKPLLQDTGMPPEWRP